MLKSLLKMSWFYRSQAPTMRTLRKEILNCRRPGALPAFVYHCVPRILKEDQNLENALKYMLKDVGGCKELI